ncbi:MAG: radical SAM protein, partial [Thermoproteota archaeon]|nr:radical SAM protein [Thermoproteota archaeon]
MKPLRIYLGDLTYDTVTISAESTPLNIGYVAAYCKKQFGDDIEISLFKYIKDLERAIRESPPDILGLSNYVWGKNVSYEMLSIMSEIDPYVLNVWGGPNFPIDFPSQEKFMKKYPKVDVYVPVDGEVGFSNIVEQALKADSKKEIKQKVLLNPIDGCVSRGIDGKLQYTIPVIRIKKLDEIPSPYTTGILDKFFDGKLTPMMQTNRGCPFHCTFCADGKDEVNQVNSFSTERVKEELDYIVKHKHGNTRNMIFSDLNFGMYPRDQETAKYLYDMQLKHNYPDFLYLSTGKNQKEKVIKAIELLKDTMPLWMSVQSLDKDVLKSIRRDNISTDHMLALYPAIKKAGLQTRAEVILGLPGETHEKHMTTLRELIRTGMDEIQVHTCMMLDGSEMGTPNERKKWKLNTKFRLLQRDFVELSSGKKVME